MASMDGSIQIVKERESKRRGTPSKNRSGIADQRNPTAFAFLTRFVSRSGPKKMVELTGIEPVTPCLQSRCSPS